MSGLHTSIKCPKCSAKADYFRASELGEKVECKFCGFETDYKLYGVEKIRQLMIGCTSVELLQLSHYADYLIEHKNVASDNRIRERRKKQNPNDVYFWDCEHESIC